MVQYNPKMNQNNQKSIENSQNKELPTHDQKQSKMVQNNPKMGQNNQKSSPKPKNGGRAGGRAPIFWFWARFLIVLTHFGIVLNHFWLFLVNFW